MTDSENNVFRLPADPKNSDRRELRKNVLSAMRSDGARVILDLSGRTQLDHLDLDLILDCAWRDPTSEGRFLIVAGSRANRAFLEVTRICCVLPVYTSMEEALANRAASEDPTADPKSLLWGVK